MRKGAWRASAHHDELVVREDATHDPGKREGVAPLRLDPVRLEEPVKPDEVHVLDVSGVGAVTGFLGHEQRHRAAGTHGAPVRTDELDGIFEAHVLDNVGTEKRAEARAREALQSLGVGAAAGTFLALGIRHRLHDRLGGT